MLSCVIIDDEVQCVDVLSAMIRQKFADKIVIKATTHEAEKAPSLINETKPDLVFLDVEMPGMNGLQVLEQLAEQPLAVVFTTAHDRYALEALKTEAIDYLLKPISLHELAIAIDKCEKQVALHKAAHLSPSSPKIVLPTGKGSVLIDLKDVIRFESSNNYCAVYFVGKPKLVVARTLKVFDDQLHTKGFFRVHQSHLINLDHLTSFQSGEPSYAVLSDGTKVEIARRRKIDFLKAIKPNL